MVSRDYLDSYVPRAGALPQYGLTLHDLGALIKRGGTDAGFIVESEYKVKTPAGERRIDWVWLDPADQLCPVAAFEIEGPAVPQDSVDADEARFRACGAGFSVIALYQVDHNRTPRDPRVHDARSRVQGMLRLPGVRVYLDEDFMKPGGIEQFRDAAVALAQSRRGAKSSGT